VVRAGGLEPPRAEPDGFSYPLRFSPPPREARRLGSGLSLRRAVGNSQGLGAARLVSTPSTALSRRSLARDRHLTGFPEFEQFCTARFRVGTQFGLSPLRLPFRHARLTERGYKRFSAAL
jgi:hypothetical protein